MANVREHIVSDEGLSEIVDIICENDGNYKAVSDFIFSLSDSERGLIRAYYFWLTSRMTKNAGIKNMAFQDTEAYAQQMEWGATDWEFIGMCDLLYRGAAHCTHGTKSVGSQGHSLRYVYYVYSRQLDLTLQFGVNCASKFLGYDLSSVNYAKVLENAKYELARALAYGRNSVALENSFEYKLLRYLRHNKLFRDKFTKELGRSGMELFLNFMYHGFVLPYKLNTTIRNVYNKLCNEAIWCTDSVEIYGKSIAPNEAYIKTRFDNKIVTTLGTKQVYTTELGTEAYTVSADTPIPVLMQLGTKWAINAVTIDACMCNHEVVANSGVPTSVIIDKLGYINKLISNYTPKNVTTSALLLSYLNEPYSPITPEFIIAESMATDNLNLMVVFFNVISAPQLTHVLIKHMDAVIKLLEGDSNARN